MNNLFHRDVYYIYRMLLRLGCLSRLGFYAGDIGSEHDMLTRQVCKVRNKHPLLQLLYLKAGLVLQCCLALLLTSLSTTEQLLYLTKAIFSTTVELTVCKSREGHYQLE